MINLKNEKILVTGANGFVGSHLVEKLVSEGAYVYALVRPRPIEEIENENLKILENSKNVKIIFSYLENIDQIFTDIEEINYIFHLAAISRPMNIDKKIYFSTNVDGTSKLISSLKKYKFKKFIHVSTVSVLGVSPDGKPLEEDDYCDLDDLYGLSKKEGERLAIKELKINNMPYNVIRPCLVYGPRCIVRKVIFKFVKLGIFPEFNKGKAKIEFLYVENLISALLSACDVKIIGEIFNITDGQSYSLKHITDEISKNFGKKNKKLIRINYFLGFILGYISEIFFKILGKHPPFSRTAAMWMSKDKNVYSCAKAKKQLNYQPKVSLETGIKKTIEWYNERNML